MCGRGWILDANRPAEVYRYRFKDTGGSRDTPVPVTSEVQKHLPVQYRTVLIFGKRREGVGLYRREDHQCHCSLRGLR